MAQYFQINPDTPKNIRLDEIAKEALIRKADIVLLQETKIKEEEEKKIAFAIKKDSKIGPVDILNTDRNRRIITLIFKTEIDQIAIHNIYAPNDQSKYKTFINDLVINLN